MPKMKAKSIRVSKYEYRWCRRALAGLLCLLTAAILQAQVPTARFASSTLTGGLIPVIDLQGIWIDENQNRHVVPFNYFDREEMELSRTFDLPAYRDLQDTLFLYCEAIAWSSEIQLNGRLLAVTDDPFAEHLLPVQKEWLDSTGNRLKIKMSTRGLGFPWYPKRFLGIFRQILLLQVDRQPRFPKFPSVVPHASTAVMFAPWGAANQFLHDSTIVRQMAQGLFSFPHDVPIAFPFRPSNESLAILGALGWKILASPADADSLAIYNAFPFSNIAGHKNLHFWRDAEMRPTHAYGIYQSQEAISNPELGKPDKAGLVIFLIIPILCMVLLKLLAPRAYGSLGEYITKTKIYLELIADNKFLKLEQRWLMNGLRMVLTATTLSLFLYYVDLSESWRMLNVFSGHSVLYEALYGKEMRLGSLFLYAFGIVVCLNLVKYMMFNGIGTVFRVFSLGSTIQNLDVFASFPTNLVPILPASFIFFLDPGVGGIVLRVWALLFILYGARRAWLIYSGMGRLYQISGSLKILYICTLEILPWVILI